MNQILLSQIGQDLQAALSQQFNLEADRVQAMVSELKGALQDGLKQFVIKSGSKELEDLYKILEDYIPKAVLTNKNRNKSWTYGYNKKYDFIYEL